MAPCSGDTLYGGDACSISCDTGFYLSSGSATLTCGADGNWVGEPQCSQNCGILTLDDGSASGRCDGNVGDSCSLSCDANFLLHVDGAVIAGSFVTRTCNPDGTWTGTMPVCLRPDCGATVAVAYSTVAVDSTRTATCSDNTLYNGDSCVVSCDDGYFISSGSATLTCGTDGGWTGAPVCTECTAIARCSGDVTCTSSSDQECSQCDAGYTASPQCGIIDCGATIPNLDTQAAASCTGNTQYGGDDCTATCNEGWQSAEGVHQGTAVFSCSASTEEWAGSLACSAMSCGALTLADGSTSGQCDGNVGDSCSLSCSTNFLLHSDGALAGALFSVRYCNADGTWTGTMPTCVRPDCGGTAAVIYTAAAGDSTRLATCSGNTMYGGDDCSVACETGYALSSVGGTFVCGSDAAWSGTVQCGIIDCGGTIPALDSHASATCTGNTEFGGDPCTASCDAGWKSAAGVHQGSATFTCSATTEAWAGLLVCSAMNCGALTVERGSTSGQCDGDVGDSCTMLGCDAGYLPSDSNLVGNARECQADGTWSGTALLCVGIPCIANTVIAHSDRTTSNPCDTGTGSNCAFTCDAGFSVQGVHSCGADGALSGGSCERNACTGGLTVPDSPTTCSGVFGDSCSYRCPTGRSATTPHICGADADFAGGACSDSCSEELQDLLDWLETGSATFSYCPTTDVTEAQGVLNLNPGKQLFIDGSGGSGGSVFFNGAFSAKVTLINAQITSSVWAVAWPASRSAGSVWVVGKNDYGQLGLGAADDDVHSTAVQLGALGSGVVHVAAGYAFSAALTAGGEVYFWGQNRNGALGLNSWDSFKPDPMHVAALGTDTVQLALGPFHAFALKQGGAVFSWGQGDNGALGHNSNGARHRHSPEELTSLGTDNAYIAAQSNGGMALKSDGRLFNWGRNQFYELGDGTTTDRLSPVELAVVGSDNVCVVGGLHHALLLKADGSVITWGWNAYGQIGNGDSNRQVRSSSLAVPQSPCIYSTICPSA